MQHEKIKKDIEKIRVSTPWVRIFRVPCPACQFINFLVFESSVSFRLGRKILFARSLQHCVYCKKMVRWSVYTDASTKAEVIADPDTCEDQNEVINEG